MGEEVELLGYLVSAACVRGEMDTDVNYRVSKVEC